MTAGVSDDQRELAAWRRVFGHLAPTPDEVGILWFNERGTLMRCHDLFTQALPKFNWGASALDANAIRLLNEVPQEVARIVNLDHLKEGN